MYFADSYSFRCRIHLWFRYAGGFVRQVDDVSATEPAHRHACARNIVTLQLQDGGYGLLRKRYSASSRVQS